MTRAKHTIDEYRNIRKQSIYIADMERERKLYR